MEYYTAYNPYIILKPTKYHLISDFKITPLLSLAELLEDCNHHIKFSVIMLAWQDDNSTR
jgi:hypothetical protein